MKTVKDLRYKRTLFVGLGGAGAKTLRLLKEQIKEVNGGKVPGQIKFLLIDTNATDLANYRDFDCSEKVCIAVREPFRRYQHDKNTSTHEFIPKQNEHSLLALERGAGQIRSNGHFAVIENQYSNKLAQVFRHAAEDLEDIDIKGERLERDPKIEVKLVFSIAGGTGSGTFLPISVLLRTSIKHCEITAYIYSATHYERIVEKSAKYAVMQNAYASLCELDYMMHFGLNNRNQIPIKFNFGPDENQQITQNNRPFEEVYYIDKITSLSTPDTVEFAYNEIDRMQKNTADALFISATNIISSHTGTIDNVRQKVMEGQFDVNDKFAWVSGLGMAELYLSPQGITAPKVVAAGNVALLARTGDCDITNDTITKIVSAFMEDRWDETKGKDDGDPILSKFIGEEDIKDTCRNVLRSINRKNEPYWESGVNLDSVLNENAKPNTSDTISTLKNRFNNDLVALIKKLLNEDGYVNEKDHGVSFITGAQGAEYGISLATLKTILERVKAQLDSSKKKINEEYKDHKEKETIARADVETFMNNNNKQQNTKKWHLFGFRQQPAQVQQISDVDYAKRLAEEKAKPLAFLILAERDKKAIEVLDGCIKHTDDALKTIGTWLSLLKAAFEYSDKQKEKVENTDPYRDRKENRVEVHLLDVDKFKLSYEDIKDIAENRNKNSADIGQSIFEQICMQISTKTGDLQHYLSVGLKEQKSKDDDSKSQFNKEHRTPLQTSIDRLIDLSTPTMQIDGHGFGDRVKADQFWYVMTDCGEDVSADSREQRKVIKSDSVGGLLKQAIEQNTLDERVNLVHVSGWSNKAILYRVLAAVPPYFVEGVCSNDCGGITLEGCYEELKKTRRTYTPFSHETLRTILENKISALKPMDAVEDDRVLDYWLNFILKGRIVIRGEGEDAAYCVDSANCGERLSNQLECRNKVLVLGKTRTEAYNTFSRYCGELIKEWKSYDKDILKPFFPDKATESKKNVFQITSCDYITITKEHNLCQYNGDIKELTMEDEDFIQLDREMTRLDKRALEYAEADKVKTLNDIFSNCKGDCLS